MPGGTVVRIRQPGYHFWERSKRLKLRLAHGQLTERMRIEMIVYPAISTYIQGFPMDIVCFVQKSLWLAQE